MCTDRSQRHAQVLYVSISIGGDVDEGEGGSGQGSWDVAPKVDPAGEGGSGFDSLGEWARARVVPAQGVLCGDVDGHGIPFGGLTARVADGEMKPCLGAVGWQVETIDGDGQLINMACG